MFLLILVTLPFIIELVSVIPLGPHNIRRKPKGSKFSII